MTTNSEFLQASHDLSTTAEVQKVGRFRFLSWPSEQARDAAANLLLKSDPTKRDEHFWDAYYSFCDNVVETPNVGISTGLGGLLCLGTGCSTSVLPFNAANSYIGVGNGLCWGTLSAGITPNGSSVTIYISSTINSYNTSKSTLSAGDVLLLTSVTSDPSSTSPFPSVAVNPEYVTIASVAGPVSSQYTITLVSPPRYTRTSSTTWVYTGNAATTGVLASSSSGMAYKGIASSFPAYSTPNSVPTITWQCNFGTADASFQWLEACIGSSSSAPSNSPGTGAATSLPTGTLLAYATWYPCPLLKGSTLASAQYVLSLA